MVNSSPWGPRYLRNELRGQAGFLVEVEREVLPIRAVTLIPAAGLPSTFSSGAAASLNPLPGPLQTHD